MCPYWRNIIETRSFSFMTTAHNILLQGIKRFLPSLFVDNDEEIVEYAVKPLLAQSG
ncbi:MltR family transcriptional regulator, partial [Salmonella enterica subsp. enterica serovar Montevideo]|nr:MltR family transcriptional regulator [Salmonella enterica subsp. enterica serovar Montevideo]